MDNDDEHLHKTVAGVQFKDPELLWIGNYYDGPLSGMVRISGEMMWADCIDECSDERCGLFRRFKVMRLDPEAIAAETEQHALFAKHVSGDGLDGWVFKPMSYRPRGEWSLFYDKYPADVITEPKGEVVGWFDWR